MPTFLVETYAPCGSDVSALVADARAAVDGDGVRYVRSIFVAEDETCFHVFEAPSAHAIAELSRRAGLADGRVVEAVEGR
jgi:hypothetical protein